MNGADFRETVIIERPYGVEFLSVDTRDEPEVSQRMAKTPTLFRFNPEPEVEVDGPEVGL